MQFLSGYCAMLKQAFCIDQVSTAMPTWAVLNTRVVLCNDRVGATMLDWPLQCHCRMPKFTFCYARVCTVQCSSGQCAKPGRALCNDRVYAAIPEWALQYGSGHCEMTKWALHCSSWHCAMLEWAWCNAQGYQKPSPGLHKVFLRQISLGPRLPIK